MGYAENRGTGANAYWRGRYKDGATGRYATVSHPDGSVIKFASKKQAEREATARETEQAQQARAAAAGKAAGRMTFAAYVATWYSALRLDEDTLATYRWIIEYHLLPHFGALTSDAGTVKMLDEITAGDVSDWEDQQRAAGYAPRGVSNRRTLLSMILGDAAADPKVSLAANVAAHRRGRGRRAEPVVPDDEDDEDDEEDDDSGAVITDPLGALLIAERASLLSGRDDEFVAIVLAYYTGLRWGELVGLEARFVKQDRVRVRWVLRERGGIFCRKRPKFGKVRWADIPDWLYGLVAAHIERTRPQPCPCHGRTYVFTGLGRARAGRKHVTAADVAAKAGVSQATVSASFHRPATVAGPTRTRIGRAADELGYSPLRNAAPRSPHWYRSGFGQWVWHPATSGQYPRRAPYPRRPVPIIAEPWPGIPARGRGNLQRGTARWEPVAEGMRPHDLRHSHKSVMAQEGEPEIMSHDRLGHKMAGIAGVYSHPTQAMRDRLMTDLTRLWQQSLRERAALNPRSPVPVLDALLAAFFSQDSPR